MHSATIFLLRVSNALTWTVTWRPSSIEVNDFYLQVNIPLFSSFWKRKENMSEKKSLHMWQFHFHIFLETCLLISWKISKTKFTKQVTRISTSGCFINRPFSIGQKLYKFLVDLALFPFCTDSGLLGFLSHIHWEYIESPWQRWLT